MKVLLGVSGCIGAYKSAIIVRLLQKAGFQVQPVMTRKAGEFIGPVTLEKLSGHKVLSDLFEDPTAEIQHIAVARRSDLLLVAPATANLLGKFAHGVADDFLSTLYLSTLTPVLVAPAMNVEMWNHPATRENLRILKDRGVIIVEPEAGYLACGEEGEGRLAEPEKIVETVLGLLKTRPSLAGLRVLVTAGPTVEDIDPVRFLSNRSSGKMGYAVAREARQRGAQVVLVSGPTWLAAPAGVERVEVRSSREMAQAVFQRFEACHVVVMAAAVSDFAPRVQAPGKLKKSELEPMLPLRPTADILKELGNRKKQNQVLVGFAAQSGRLQDQARQKLLEKKLDWIVANDISKADQGFQSDFNQVILMDRSGNTEELPRLAKTEVAEILWDRIETWMSSGIREREEPAVKDPFAR